MKSVASFSLGFLTIALLSGAFYAYTKSILPPLTTTLIEKTEINLATPQLSFASTTKLLMEEGLSSSTATSSTLSGSTPTSTNIKKK